MPPTNNSGYDISVGPDADGAYFDVPDGESYTLPKPPTQVTGSDTADDEPPVEAETPADDTTPPAETEQTPAPTSKGKPTAAPAPEGD